MAKVTFNAENWIDGEITVAVQKNGDFHRNGDWFTLVSSDVASDYNDGGKYDTFTTTYESDYGQFMATRMGDDKYYIAFDTGIERTGKTAMEAIVKIIAMTV